MEERTISGVGIVIGLNGTGDSEYGPNIRALAAVLAKNGLVMPVDNRGIILNEELKSAKNCALVIVTATIPETGAMRGAKVNVQIDTLHNASSLEGGTLYLAALTDTPNDPNPLVAAWAYGKIEVGALTKTTGKIKRGADIMKDMKRVFTFDEDLDGEKEIYFIIDPKKASFQLANEIASNINDHAVIRQLQTGVKTLAQATGVSTVRVRIPKAVEEETGEDEDQDEEDLVVSLIGVLMTDVQIVEVPPVPRVLINEQAGSILVGKDVQIQGVGLSTAGFNIENPNGSEWIPLEVGSGGSTDSLQDLIKALSALKAPIADKIEIIKMLDDAGYLYGELVIEN